MSKKRSFKHFDEAARTVIEITENGFNITGQKAAEFLLCSEAAINEEVKRNYYFGKYSASKAQEASKKRKNKTKKRPILEDPKIGKYIEEKLNLGWTPDEIAGRSKLDPEAKNISRASVYNYIYAPKNHDKQVND